MGSTIGIDLGTTNSVVAVMEGDHPTVIANAAGGRTTPSIVAIGKDGKVVVGEIARRQAVTNPERTIRSIKSFMGQKVSDTTEKSATMSYKDKIVADKDGFVAVEFDGQPRPPAYISALILMDLKKTAQDYLGYTVTDAVITVPAYFDDLQRTATRNAAEIAGFEKVRIVNEPTAAALAYGLGDSEKEQKVLVFDLGGGTFDVSILDIGDGVFEVKATGGDTALGGDDYTERIVNYIAEAFKATEGIDLRVDKISLQRLVEAAETAKKELSTMDEVQINQPFITADANGPKHLDISITRAKFEEITRDLTERCAEPFRRVLADAKLTPSQIDQVVLVGGSTRMPAIQTLVRDLSDGKEPHKGINPDEVVAAGAAIQGGVLKGEVQNVLLLDVTPLTLGIETKGGVVDQMIFRNTQIPTKEVRTFPLASADQTSVKVHVLQGESELAERNRSLGNFSLRGIRPDGNTVPYVQITYEVDADGIVHVKACQVDVNDVPLPGQSELDVTVSGGGGMSKADVDRMVASAQANEAEDTARVELIKARNHGEALNDDTKRVLAGEIPFSDAEREELNAAMDVMAAAVGTDDTERIVNAIDSLQACRVRAADRMEAETAANEVVEEEISPSGVEVDL